MWRGPVKNQAHHGKTHPDERIWQSEGCQRWGIPTTPKVPAILPHPLRTTLIKASATSLPHNSMIKPLPGPSSPERVDNPKLNPAGRKYRHANLHTIVIDSGKTLKMLLIKMGGLPVLHARNADRSRENSLKSVYTAPNDAIPGYFVVGLRCGRSSITGSGPSRLRCHRLRHCFKQCFCDACNFS